MNKHNFPFLAFFILVAVAVTETALIAAPHDNEQASLNDVDEALVGPARAAAYPKVLDGPRINGADFSVPALPGFTGAALLSGDVVMTSRTARVDVKRASVVRASDCAQRVEASATMAKHEAWRADGEGGCRAWMSLPRRHVIEVVVNHGAHAYVVTCASKDANVVQDVCALVVGGLLIETNGKPTTAS